MLFFNLTSSHKVSFLRIVFMEVIHKSTHVQGEGNEMSHRDSRVEISRRFYGARDIAAAFFGNAAHHRRVSPVAVDPLSAVLSAEPSASLEVCPDITHRCCVSDTRLPAAPRLQRPAVLCWNLTRAVD